MMFQTFFPIALLLTSLTPIFAKDLRAFSSTGCVGAFFTCLALPSGGCCNSIGSPWASVRLTDGSSVARTVGFSNGGCSGSSAITLGGGCAGSSFALFSAQWIASGSRIAGRVSSPAPEGECSEPTGFGFIDETGDVFEGEIREDRKEEIIAAVIANNQEAVKAALR